MSKVIVMDHPLIQHKIGWIRRADTGSKDFRTLISEIAMLMCYEATRDLELTDVEIDHTDLCYNRKGIKRKEISSRSDSPVAGLGMVDGMLSNDSIRKSRSYRTYTEMKRL